MLRSKATAMVWVAAMVFGLALNAELNSARWSDGGGFLVSAAAQMPVDGCAPSLIPHRVDGAEYYICDNGEYYRDIGGEIVKVDKEGQVLPGAESNESKPEDGSTTTPALPAAEPHFQEAPKN